jgi:hypothetical protein
MDNFWRSGTENINYIDGNALSKIQLFAQLEEGHEVDTAIKANSFVNLSVLPTLGRTYRSVMRKNSAVEEKSKMASDIFLM